MSQRETRIITFGHRVYLPDLMHVTKSQALPLHICILQVIIDWI